MSNHTTLSELLQLEPLVGRSMRLPEFLRELKAHPEIADTAPALLVRAIKSKGLVTIESQPEERRPFLRLLGKMKIPCWNAFDHVRGSQRTVARILNHLEAAAANGYQLRTALILLGGPACGKSFLADAIKAALEGQEAYVVDGCPIHENPINLLKLLTAKQRAALAEALDMHDPDKGVTIDELVKVAGEPCRACWQKVMLSKKEDSEGVEPCKTPNLDNISVSAMRLSSRNFGIATWSQSAPGQGCSLVEALRQGSSGVVDMPELCAVQKAEAGATLEIDALIDATDARRIIDHTQCGSNAGYLPLNAVLLGQTNQGGWDEFIKSQKDANKFTRRMNIMSVPYITARIEEEMAYRDFLSGMKDQPHTDPLALKVAATLAVLSRVNKVDGLSPIDLVRLYNGEEFLVLKQGRTSSSRDTFSSSSSMSSAPAVAWNEKELAELITKAGDVADERKREGMFGLDMSFMLKAMSQVTEFTLRHKHPEKPACLSSLSVIKFLRDRLTAYRQTSGLTEQEKEILKVCLEDHLKRGEMVTDPCGSLELEYRRLLRDQILEVFAPDFDRRAAEDFERYRLHASAYGQGKAKVYDPKLKRDVEVDTQFLDSIDRGRTLNPNLDSVQAYRGSIDAMINQLVFSHAQEHGNGDDTEKANITWRTLPELAKAIEERLNAEISKQVERIVTLKRPDLKADEQQHLDESLARFKKLGYCESCLEQALAYAKELKLWQKQS